MTASLPNLPKLPELPNRPKPPEAPEAPNRPTRKRIKGSREAQKEGQIQDGLARARAYLRQAPQDWDGADPEPWHRAKREMAKVENAAQEPRHWGDITKCWALDFRLADDTERCMSKTIDLAYQDTRVATVDYRIKEVDDAGNVTRHVIGHRMVPTPLYIETLFAIIFYAAGEVAALKESMRRAYNIAANFQSSIRAYLPSDEATLRYFDQSESMLSWLYIAQIWATELKQRELGLRCAAKAEAIAADLSSIPQWVEVAKFWMRAMGDPEQARRCVAEAEKTLNDPTPQSYISLAEGVAILGDPDLPVQYLDKAESLIEELSDWSLIKYTWEELGYFDRAERADHIWEYLAAKITEEQYIANGGGYGKYAPGDGPY